MGLDEEVIKHVTSSNVACGYHAGDPIWMQHTVNLAKASGVAIGAHPSYPDLLGFGAPQHERHSRRGPGLC